MWLADDDYLEPDCLLLLTNVIQNNGSAFSGYNQIINGRYVKKMDLHFGQKEIKGYDGVIKFLNAPLPNMIYALHNTIYLKTIVTRPFFDFNDFDISIRMIDKFGANFVEKNHLFNIGIDGNNYTLKPYNGFMFNPIHYGFTLCKIAIKYKSFSIILKLISFIKWCIFLNYLLLFKDGKLEE